MCDGQCVVQKESQTGPWSVLVSEWVQLGRSRNPLRRNCLFPWNLPTSSQCGGHTKVLGESQQQTEVGLAAGAGDSGGGPMASAGTVLLALLSSGPPGSHGRQLGRSSWRPPSPPSECRIPYTARPKTGRVAADRVAASPGPGVSLP